MVGPQRRLDALTSELTPSERAVLTLRAWCAGEDADERVTRYCPPQDEAQVARLVRAVERGNNDAHMSLIILLEWAALAESEVHWSLVLTAFQRREAALEAVARKTVAALPAPWDFGRKVPLGWGRLVSDGDEEIAHDWAEVRAQCVAQIKRSLCRRWQEVLGLDQTFEELRAAMGEEMMHEDVRKLLDALREHVLRLHQVMVEQGEGFELPNDPGEQLATFHDAFDWNVIRDVPKEKHAREWMHEKQLAELEDWEEEQAESLRGRG